MTPQASVHPVAPPGDAQPARTTSDRRILQKSGLGELFARLTGAGWRIVAPVTQTAPEAQASGVVQTASGSERAGRGDATRIIFAPVQSPDTVVLDYIQSNVSAKEVVFPRYEPMLRFNIGGREVAAEEIRPAVVPTVLFGVHPCDAASFATLEAVFTWDSSDVYFEPRRANLIIVGLSCTRGDEYCFCTSVNGGPGDPRGSDVLLTPLDGQKFLVEVLTEKGQALVEQAAPLFTPADGASKEAVLARIAPRFDAAQLGLRLPDLFNKGDVWLEQSLRCVGCGCCAYVCPTCSCFDIQDERDRYQGERVRCWDSCGFGLFTLHASGHNPRHVQSERWRQRVMHKFSYQPERLGVLGCVGCGRCSRACPVDMNLGEHMRELAENSE